MQLNQPLKQSEASEGQQKVPIHFKDYLFTLLDNDDTKDYEVIDSAMEAAGVAVSTGHEALRGHQRLGDSTAVRRASLERRILELVGHVRLPQRVRQSDLAHKSEWQLWDLLGQIESILEQRLRDEQKQWTPAEWEGAVEVLRQARAARDRARASALRNRKIVAQKGQQALREDIKRRSGFARLRRRLREVSKQNPGE